MNRRKSESGENSRNLARPGQTGRQRLKAGCDMSVARDRSRLNRTEKEFTATTQVVNSTEPPGADPHARWCGRGGRETAPPYPDLRINERLDMHVERFFELISLKN